MIVHLITSLDVGGAELVLANLLAGLSPDERQKHRVISLIKPGVVADKIRALDIAVSDIGMTPGRPTLGALLRLLKDLHTTPGWFIHGWMYHANLMATFACLLSMRPRAHLWGIRNSLGRIEGEKSLTRLIIHFGAWLSFLPRVILYAAKRSAEQHEALGYAKAHRTVIANGYDLARFQPNPAANAALKESLGINALIIGHVGRWDWSKDHANMLAALALVPEAHGVFVGRNVDAQNADLMALIRQYGVENRVHLLGYRADVETIVPGFDVACLSSRTESMPNAVCEAMACGVPCVVTDVGDAAEIVGETGLVVPPENSAALAEALKTLLASDRVTLGGAARKRVESAYERRQMIDAYRALWHRLGWV